MKSDYIPDRLVLVSDDTIRFSGRRLTRLGIEADVEYAQDQYGVIYYRFVWDRPDVRDSWKHVAY